jgi:Zn-dependent metalloprotease
MKIKPIIAAAVLLATFAASALPASAAQETASEAIAAGSRIAAENGIDIASDEAAIALNIVNNANAGTLPAIFYNEDATVRTIQGAVTGNIIRNEKDAAAALKNVAALLGIKDFDSLVFDSVEDGAFRSYVFRQFYQGLKVESGYLSLIVDKETKKAVYLNNTFAADLDLDVTPVLTAEQAGRIAANEMGLTEFNAPELTIFRTDSGAYRLAWSVSNDENGAYIDARDGEILHRVMPSGFTSYGSTYTYNASMPNPVTNSRRFTVNCEYSDECAASSSDFWRLHDRDRNIWIMGPSYDANFEDSNMQMFHNNLVYNQGVDYFWEHFNDFEIEYSSYFTSGVNRRSTKDWTTSEVDKVSVGILYHAEKAYDFYKNRYGYLGTNGRNAALAINPYAHDKLGRPFGSCASPYGNLLQFGYQNLSGGGFKSDVVGYDVVAHEYTHRVTASIVRWLPCGQTGETAALSEAYSDIMAELSSTDARWKMGEGWNADGSCLRDLTYCGGATLGSQMYKYTTASQMANAECHDASTILSHAAYLIAKYGVPYPLQYQIWFSSMSFLPKGIGNAKFRDALSAMQYVSSFLVDQYTSNNADRLKYKSKILMAFNAVNLKNTSYKMGDVNMDGRVTTGDINFINQYYRGDRTFSVLQLSLADVNYDGVVTTADSDTIARAISRGTQNSL